MKLLNFMRVFNIVFLCTDLVVISVYLYIRTKPDVMYVYSGMASIVLGWAFVFAIAAALFHAYEIRQERRDNGQT